MTRSKLFIGIFISVILIVIAIVLLACTVFVVRHVSVESDVSSYLLDEESIVESSGLSIGRSIISIRKEKIKTSIEKENPYVQVLGIRRVFPNKVIIRATVRTSVMIVTSSDGQASVLIDSSLKVLNVRRADEESETEATPLLGVTFDIPESGAQSLVGTKILLTDAACADVLTEIAEFTADYDLQGQSFTAFFKAITFDTTDGIKVYIRTNKGVSLVLDKSLPSAIYDQLYICLYFYTTSKDVSIDRTRGFIAFDKTKNAYAWVETLD